MDNNENNKKFDLTIRMPKKKRRLKNRRPIDPRLPFNNCVFGVLLGNPGTGKTTNILNLFSSQFCRGLWSKHYLIGASLAHDPTLQPIIDHYHGSAFEHFDDSLLKSIVEGNLQAHEDEKNNVCIIVDDALSLGKKLEKSSYLGRLAGSHRHWLSSKNHPGCVLLGSQKFAGYGGFPTAMRACVNVLIIFKVNYQQIKYIIESYGSLFGGDDYLESIIKYCLSKPYNSCNIYLDGNGETNQPIIYSGWSQQIYPSSLFPEKDLFKVND